jgi:hypothetical protein
MILRGGKNERIQGSQHLLGIEDVSIQPFGMNFVTGLFCLQIAGLTVLLLLSSDQQRLFFTNFVCPSDGSGALNIDRRIKNRLCS